MVESRSVELDELDVMIDHHEDHVEPPRKRSKLEDINQNNNKDCEVEIIPECSRDNDNERTKCYICDIDIPVILKLQHEQSSTHVVNLKIINIALKRMAKHNEHTSLTHQTNSINYCRTCSNIVKTTENHESSIEHQQSTKQDRFLKYFLSFYENKSNINEIVTDIIANFVRDVEKNKNSIPNENIKDRSDNLLEVFFKNINMPNGNIKVLNDTTVVIQIDNSTLECDIDNFHGIKKVEGSIQCIVCRVVVDDVLDHINSNVHVTKVSAEIVKCCLRKIDNLFYHCILCNKIVYFVEFHEKGDDKHEILLKEKYTVDNRKSHINEGAKNGNEKNDRPGFDGEPEIRINDDFYCKDCDLIILDNETAANTHLHNEKHKSRTSETECNNNKIIRDTPKSDSQDLVLQKNKHDGVEIKTQDLANSLVRKRIDLKETIANSSNQQKQLENSLDPYDRDWPKLPIANDVPRTEAPSVPSVSYSVVVSSTKHPTNLETQAVLKVGDFCKVCSIKVLPKLSKLINHNREKSHMVNLKKMKEKNQFLNVVHGSCIVCNVELPQYTNAIVHNKGSTHMENLEKMRLENYIDKFVDIMFCNLCRDNVYDVVEHVLSGNHQISIKLRESNLAKKDDGEYCFEKSCKPECVSCCYCYEEVPSQSQLRTQHVLTTSHKQGKDKKLNDNFIRKYHGRYHCMLCLEDFEFGTALSHMRTRKHYEQSVMVFAIDSSTLALNYMDICDDLEDSLRCRICQKNMPDTILDFLEHIESTCHTQATSTLQFFRSNI